MTTSWAYAVRGQVSDSLRVNAGGTMLAAIDLVGIVMLAGHSALARWPSRRWLEGTAWGLAAAMSIAVADWIGRIW